MVKVQTTKILLLTKVEHTHIYIQYIHRIESPLSSPVQSNQNLQYVLLTPLQNEGRYYTNSKKNLFARASLFLFLD